MNLLHQKSKVVPLCCLLLLVFFSSAWATEEGDSQWQFQIAPYGWLAGQSGTVATLPGLPPADIDVDFWDDILGNINGALFLVGEARKDRWGMFMDLAYVDIESEEGTPGPLFSTISSRTESWIISGTGFYRLLEKPGAFLDLLAGVRYWYVDSTLTLQGLLLPGQEVSNSENWLDPLIGFKGLSSLGETKFFVSGGISIGGFGAGSDFMWDANMNLGYQWTKTFSTVIGYRYLDVDYEKDDFLYDVSQDGPILGLSWRF